MNASRWKAKDVASASGIPNESLQRWLDRSLIRLSGHDKDSDGSGQPRQFSLRRVHQISIAHALTLAGVQPATAISLASLFTETSQPNREAGDLFASGKTLIVTSPAGTGCVVNLPADRVLDDVVTGEVATVVDVGKIVSRVNSRLGLSNAFRKLNAVPEFYASA